jgi:uncharacterized protein DUF3536
LRMLEMQRHLMLMYTSCGWFFDEPTGPETVQVFQYAGRAVQLGDALFGGDREEQFLQHLEKVHSNIAEFGNGRRIYERFVRPAMLDLFGAAAHYVISSLFDGYLKRESVYCYAANLYDGQVFTQGKAKLAVGRARITSRITRAQLNFNFAVLYRGDHQLVAGISPTSQGDEFQAFIDYVASIFSQGDLALCSSAIEQYFGNKTYSLKCLFRDEQERIITQLVEASLTDIDEIYRKAHEQHAPQISFLSDLQIPLPSILQALGQFVLGNAIRRYLAEEKTDFEQIRKLLETAKRDCVNLSESSLNPSLRHRLDTLLRRWRRKPADLATIQALESAVLLAKVAPFNVDLWEAQNQYYELLQTISSTSHFHVDRTWLGHFHKLGEELGVAPSQSFAAVMAYSVKDEANIATRAHESSRPASKAENRLPRGTQGSQLSM